MSIIEDVAWLKSLKYVFYDGCLGVLSTDVNDVYFSEYVCTDNFDCSYSDDMQYALDTELVFEYDPKTDIINIYDYGIFNDSEYGIPAEHCKNHLQIGELGWSISDDFIRFYSCRARYVEPELMYKVQLSEEYIFQLSITDAGEVLANILKVRDAVRKFFNPVVLEKDK